MEWSAVLGTLLALLVVGLASGLPVAFAFMAINIVGLYFFVGGTNALQFLVWSAFDSVGSFALSPVPLFILLGEILVTTGLAAVSVDAVDKWAGRLPGRLALVAVGGGTIFGALSGSAMAATAFLASTLLPEMERRGYKPPMSVASILAAAGLDILIPPSALAVVLGALANISIGQLLIASIIPGLVLAVVYAVYFIVRAKLQPYLAPAYERAETSTRDRLLTLLHLFPMVGIMTVVTGFIFLGIATASETAALGAVASMLLAATYGRLSLKLVRTWVVGTIGTTAMVFMIMVGSKAYSQVLAMTGAADGFIQAVTAIPVGPMLKVVMMQVVLFILGWFIDELSTMLITVPIFMPVVTALDLDPIWFGVIFLANLTVGAISPPFGLQLFVIKGLAPHHSMWTISMSTVPIMVLQFLVIGLVMAFPPLATWLPSLMVRR